MPFIKFTNFETKFSLSTGDFLVGYSDDSTSNEYKSTVANVWGVYTNYQTLSYNENSEILQISNSNSVSLSTISSKTSLSVYTNVLVNSSLWGGILPIKQISATTYTLSASDVSKLLVVNSENLTQIIIPHDNNIENTSKFQIVRYGSGGVSIVPSDNVNLRSANNHSYLTSRYSVATLVKLFSNNWELYGDISPFVDLTPTPSVTQTITPTPNASPTPTETPTNTPTFTPTKTITPTETPSPTPTPTIPPENGVVVIGSGASNVNTTYVYNNPNSYINLDNSDIYFQYDSGTQAWWLWDLSLDDSDAIYATQQYSNVTKPWFGTWVNSSQNGPFNPMPIVLEDLPPINAGVSTPFVAITNNPVLSGTYEWTDRLFSTFCYVRSDDVYLIIDPVTSGLGYWGVFIIGDLSTPYAKREDATDETLLPRNAWSLNNNTPLSAFLISVNP